MTRQSDSDERYEREIRILVGEASALMAGDTVFDTARANEIVNEICRLSRDYWLGHQSHPEHRVMIVGLPTITQLFLGNDITIESSGVTLIPDDVLCSAGPDVRQLTRLRAAWQEQHRYDLPSDEGKMKAVKSEA